jgi:hypothetical protein
MKRLPLLIFFLVVLGLGDPPARSDPPRAPSPEERGLAYLARETPRWSKENRCYSCHHNGDAARALYRAVALKRDVPKEALADTTAWLVQPGRWDKNGGEGPFSDKKLADLQFAAALSEAKESGLATDRAAFLQAAERVAGRQDPDGSWRVTPVGTLGGPTTHGVTLATVLARQSLVRLDRQRHERTIDQSEAWLGQVQVSTLLDAGALLLAGDVQREAACLKLIREGQSKDGGWGPYVNSPPEVFDTAVVLLGLRRLGEIPEFKDRIARGREWLIRSQQPDGSWQETTRPAGGDSYAQRLSTSAWATLALLETAR